MNIKKKLVSILVNNYNNEKYIKNCINSCLDQTYKNIEVIIYDDNSSDRSISIINKLKDKRIKKIFNKKKYSKSSSRNQFNSLYHSIKKTKGELIFLLDGDDFFDKKKIEFIVKVFNKNSNIKFIQDQPIYFYPSTNKKVKKKLKEKKIVIHTWPYFNATSTMSFKKKFLQKILKEIEFSKKSYDNLWFDARSIIYTYFFEKKNVHLILKNYFTFYTQNPKGFASNFLNDRFSSQWWNWRQQHHHFTSKLFSRKNKFHIKLFDYYITSLFNFFSKILT